MRRTESEEGINESPVMFGGVANPGSRGIELEELDGKRMDGSVAASESVKSEEVRI